MPDPNVQPSKKSLLMKVKSHQFFPRLPPSQYESIPSYLKSVNKADNPRNLTLADSTSLDKKLNSQLKFKPVFKDYSKPFNSSSLRHLLSNKQKPFKKDETPKISSKDTSWQSKFQSDYEDKTSTEQSSIQQIDQINNQYQLSGSNVFALQKKIQFHSETTLLENKKRQTFIQKKNQLVSKTRKNTSILKSHTRMLDQSLSTQKSYSVQNSLIIRRKNKSNFANTPYSGNNNTKEKYIKHLKTLRGGNSSSINHHQKSQQNAFVFQGFSYQNASNMETDLQSQQLKAPFDYKRKSAKFTDQIFPPVYSSLFRIINGKTSRTKIDQIKDRKGKQIEWIRLSQLFKGQKVKIFNNVTEKSTQIKICKGEIQGKSYYESDMMVGALNAIKNNRMLLHKMLENQQELNPYGIYLINIYVDNHWKYVIVDDFIPVIKIKQHSVDKSEYCNMIPRIKMTSYRPAFLNIDFTYAESQLNQYLYLWPFLIQKAYASYYSCYDALNYGKILDFLTQLCGVPYQVLNIPQSKSEEFGKDDNKKVIEKLGVMLRQKSMTALAYSDDQLPYVPLYLSPTCSNINQNEVLLVYDDPLNNYDACQVNIKQVGNLFSKIYLFNTNSFMHTSYSQVYPIKNKDDHTQTLVENQLIPQSTSIRTFNIDKHTNGFLSIRQKQNRLYMKKQAQYLWVRTFLFCKLYDGEYQWIDAKYTNKKTICYKLQLPPGQYYLIIMPEWKQSHNREITIVFDSDNDFIMFERKVVGTEQKIIEMGCMDLAQKKGQLHQISSQICSYTIVSQSVGIIIENVCNQRPKGQITIMRSIEGLKARCRILPINSEFYASSVPVENQFDSKNYTLAYTNEKPEIVNRKLKGQLEIDIPALQSFTIVLKMIGGIDFKFFKAFKF